MHTPRSRNRLDLLDVLQAQNLALDVLPHLDSRDLATVRAASRSGRSLIDANYRKHLLNYYSCVQLLQPAAAGEDPGVAKKRSITAEAEQPSAWAAALQGSCPPFTAVTISVLPKSEDWLITYSTDYPASYSRLIGHRDLLGELLGPVEARLDGAARRRVRRLRLQHDKNVVSGLVLPTGAPERLAHIFPALTDLEIVGEWKYASPAFYTALAAHLPGLRNLRVDLDPHLGALSGRLAALRVLSLDVFGHAGEAPEAALTALRGGFPALSVLRLVEPFSVLRSSTRSILRGGLAPTLMVLELIVNSDGTSHLYLRATRATSHRATRASNRWDVVLGGAGLWDRQTGDEKKDILGLLDVLVDAGMPLGHVRVLEAGVAAAPSEQLLRSCRRLDVESLVVRAAEMDRLPNAVRVLGPPAVLRVKCVTRRSQLAPLAAQVLAPRLSRLEFISCSGLTTAQLVALLSALPLCEVVVLDSCRRFATAAQLRELVRRVLEMRKRRRPVRVLLRGRTLRPLGDEDSDEDGEALYRRVWYASATTEQQVAWTVAALVQRAAAAEVVEELNGVLERGRAAVRLGFAANPSAFTAPAWYVRS